MSAAYVPRIGDRVRMREWGAYRWLDVVAIERGYLFGFEDDDEPSTWTVASDWIKVTSPVVYPERWFNVNTGFGGRIALIHLATDGTLTLHPVEGDQ